MAAPGPGMATLLLTALLALSTFPPLVPCSRINRVSRRHAGDPCASLHRKLLGYQRKVNAVEGFLFARPSDVVACTRSVAFHRRRDVANLHSVMLYFKSFYPLIHIAKHSPDPRLGSSYDILGELRKLEAQNWTVAEDFYSSIANAVDRLNDAHTSLHSVCPPFYHALAFSLVSVVENGSPVVRVAPKQLLDGFITTIASKQPPFSFDTAPYFGARVLSINGKEAWSLMLRWSHNYAGGYHDPSQRLNSAFAAMRWSDGERTATPGTFAFRYTNPRSDFAQMRVMRAGSKKVETINVPWLTFTFSDNLPGFTSKQMYYSGFCLSQTPVGTPQSALSPRQGHPILGLRNEKFLWPGTTLSSAAPEANTRGRYSDAVAEGKLEAPAGVGPLRGTFNYSDSEHLALLGEVLGSRPRPRIEAVLHRAPEVIAGFAVPAGERGVGMGGEQNHVAINAAGHGKLAGATLLSSPGFLFPVYKLRDGKTGVVVVSAFYADAQDVVATVTNEAIRSFNLADKHTSQVIVDLSGNGGGVTQAGWWLISLLMGSRRFPNPRSHMQDNSQFLADTRLVLAMRKLSLGWYSWQQYADPLERPYVRATSGRFFKPILKRSFGPRGNPGLYSQTFKLPMPSLAEQAKANFPPILGAKPILLFSDGQCFSTCMNFAYYLRRQFKVPLVTVGGIPGRPMAFSGGGGGFVISDVEGDMLSTFTPEIARRADAPKKFSMRLRFGMRFVHGLTREQSRAPIEFTFLQADAQIPYTLQNIADPSLQYLEVAKHFGLKV